jgi:hypothetical protein
VRQRGKRIIAREEGSDNGRAFMWVKGQKGCKGAQSVNGDTENGLRSRRHET